MTIITIKAKKNKSAKYFVVCHWRRMAGVQRGMACLVEEAFRLLLLYGIFLVFSHVQDNK